MAFTVQDFIAVLRDNGADELSELITEFPEEVEPFLDRIQNRIEQREIHLGALELIAQRVVQVSKNLGRCGELRGIDGRSADRQGHDQGQRYRNI